MPVKPKAAADYPSRDRLMQAFRMPRDLVGVLKQEADEAGTGLTAHVLRYLEGIRTWFGLSQGRHGAPGGRSPGPAAHPVRVPAARLLPAKPRAPREGAGLRCCRSREAPPPVAARRRPCRAQRATSGRFATTCSWLSSASPATPRPTSSTGSSSPGRVGSKLTGALRSPARRAASRGRGLASAGSSTGDGTGPGSRSGRSRPSAGWSRRGGSRGSVRPPPRTSATASSSTPWSSTRSCAGSSSRCGRVPRRRSTTFRSAGSARTTRRSNTRRPSRAPAPGSARS